MGPDATPKFINNFICATAKTERQVLSISRKTSHYCSLLFPQHVFPFVSLENCASGEAVVYVSPK